MTSNLRKLAAISIVALSAFASISPASAEVPDSGIDINHDAPNYDITIHCDLLPTGGQESYTGPTQHGSYTIHADDMCQNGANDITYFMQVDDNGDTDEAGGFTVNGVPGNNNEWMPIPASFSLLPDTYVTIRSKYAGNWNSDYYNIRYNGSDPNQVTPVTEVLSHTGIDSGLLMTGAAALMASGFALLFRPKKQKN